MKNFLKENWFKILGIIVLIVAVGNHPYSYYQLLRWAIMIISGYSAYLANENKNITWAWIFGIIAILFNPIFPFYFSKNTWQVIDIITTIILFINIINFKKLHK